MKIIIFGSTGSIGQSTLSLIRLLKNTQNFKILALTGNDNIDQLCKDAIEFKVKRVVTANKNNIFQLKHKLSSYNIEVLAGEEAILDTARMGADWIISAIVGFAGVPPTLESVKYCKIVAIANKESLVCAGKLLIDMAITFKSKILPVDSEHNAIFQCINHENPINIKKVTLTASGGPFRNFTLAEMAKVTVAQAIKHPTWAMGKRISIDSASMFNKALELIEAKYFFELNSDQLEVVIHPESIIHSMVTFIDNSTLAQLGPNDMRNAIAHTLNYPERKKVPINDLDLTSLKNLSFEVVDVKKFPSINLARMILNTKGSLGIVFNAAKEIALDRFICNDIKFLDMSILVEKVLLLPEMNEYNSTLLDTIEDIIDLNKRVRQISKQIKI
ncbi:MAG: 1-deoxy-D-xylulose-5-phosphate reductoisomerase [Paracoccaceae bacterium]|tara:strand:+ start:429 stop:1592 length:1164 start_codon:yes stop_codon:yes gene_type:complete